MWTLNPLEEIGEHENIFSCEREGWKVVDNRREGRSAHGLARPWPLKEMGPSSGGPAGPAHARRPYKPLDRAYKLS